MGRILAIGDIHGCSAALDTLLEAAALTPADTIVTLGDYVDRGPDSRGVLDRLIALGRTHHLVPLRGNHELMLLDAHRDRGVALSEWRKFGGDATLASYGSSTTDAIPEAHWRFIEEQCVDCWEADTHFFVHASAYPDVPVYEQPRYILYWCRFNNPPPHQSGKVMVCGHTAQKSGLPLNLGHAVCIDTWVYGETGWLSCLDTASEVVTQANQLREVRHLRLDDLLVPAEE